MKKDISFIKMKLMSVFLLLTLNFSFLAAKEYTDFSISADKNISVAAKKGTVTGKVTIEDGKSLQGASIVIRGTIVGTISDTEGKFMLKNVSEDAELQISYVGLKTIQVKPDFTQPLNIRMGISIQGVQTVVVHPAPEIEPLSVIDDEFGIRIKGIIDNNPPLFVLDGKEISRSDFNKLDANKIGSISAVKDESTVEKFGEKGKNGVIVITSKVSLPAPPSLGLGSITVPSDEKKKAKKPVFTIVEEIPQFPGGEKRMIYYLSEYVKYPPQAKANKVEGTVVVSFIVSKTGRVENAKVVKSVHQALDAEAVRIVSSMPYWTPGKQNGIPVDVYYTIPIEFRLQDSGKGTSDAGVSEMENLQEQLAGLQEQMLDNQNNMADLQKLAASDQKLNFEHHKQITGLQKQMAELGKQISDDQKQMETLQKSLTASRDQNADYQKQIASFRSQLGDRQKQMRDLQSQLRELQAQVAPVLYRQIETMPQFSGGETEMMKFIRLNLKYPVTARVNGITGSALVLFIVDRNGKIANAMVTNEIDPSLRAEALRVIKRMPDWTPGQQGGKPVNVFCTIPIRFILKSGFVESDEERSFLKGDFPEVVVVGFGIAKPASSDKQKEMESSDNSVVDPASYFNKLSESGSNPLILYDDKEIGMNEMRRLAEQQPSVIEEITVMQDKIALKMIGDKGKNGAIVVSSRKNTRDAGSKLAKISWIGVGVPKKEDHPYYFGPPLNSPQVDEDPVFVVVEKLPQFPGGEKAMLEFIQKNIKYPEIAKRNKIQGTVLVNFVINKEGKIIKPKIMKSPSEALSEEALRILSIMPDWVPGKQKGQAVSVSYTIPVKFTLAETV